MIITCPDCHTNYNVKPVALGAMGRKVKCANCGYQWFQEPASAEQKQAAVDPDILSAIEEARQMSERIERSPEKKQLPAIHTPKPPLPWGMLTSATLMLLVALAIGAVAFRANTPFKEKIETMLGMTPTSDVAFGRFEANSRRVDNRLHISFDGEVVNHSDTVMTLPHLHITLLSSGGRVMPGGEIVMPFKQEVIEPGEVINFKQTLTGVKGNTSIAHFDIGSSWELSVR